MSKNLLARYLALAAVLLVTLLLAWSYHSGGIAYLLLGSGLSAEEKIEALKDFFAKFGFAAPLAYVAFVIMEVIIAPIPGAMLYAPGGVLFGGFWGGLLSLVGNVLGAGLAYWLMRVFLAERAEHYFSHSRLASLVDRISRRGGWVIFLLRVNPLTSTDLVSYAAGLTHISAGTVMLGTLAGLAPTCFVQAYLAEGLLEAFPNLLYPLIIAGVVYLVIVIWVISKLVKRQGASVDPDSTDSRAE